MLLLGACAGASVSDGSSVEDIVQTAGDGNVDGGLFWAVFVVMVLAALIVGVVTYYRDNNDNREEAAFHSFFKGVSTFFGVWFVYSVLGWVSRLYVDYLWYADHGYPQVFWVTKALPWAIGIAFGLLACLTAIIIGTRFFPIAKAVYIEHTDERWRTRFGDEEKEKVWQYNFRRRVINLVPWILGLVMGMYAATSWNEIALYVAQQPFGTVDPIFGRDISYYVFTLPFYRILRNWLMILVEVTAINGMVRWYFTEYGNSDEKETRLLRFLGTLVLPLTLLFAWGVYMAKFGLLTDNNGSFTGVGYADVEGGRILLFNVLTLLTGAAIIPLWYGLRKQNWRLFGLVVLAVLVARFLVGAEGLLLPTLTVLIISVCGVWFLDFANGERRLQLRTVVSVAAVTLVFTLFWSWPAVIQIVRVNPNELGYESDYIRHHIDFTRAAYGLDKVETFEFPYVDSFEGSQYAASSDTLEESRTFGWREVRDLSNQTQFEETYYEILDTDLYYEDGEVWMTTPRELLPGQIPNQNFVNNHLRFLCGFGMVAAEPNQVTPQGHPQFVASQLPTVGDERFIPQNQRICYGEGSTSHVYVNTTHTEIVPASVKPEKFAGQRGVLLGSGFRRIAFALSFGSIRVLTSDAMTPETRVLYYRQVDEMLERLTPFVVWDTDPFMIAGEDQYIWMNEGVITASGYPYSVEKSGLSRETYNWFNYASPGITGTISAYDGEVYIYAEDGDPVLEAWGNLFPNLLRPMKEMPADVVQNRRYPYDFFEMQAGAYGLYHLTSVQDFFGKTRMWLPTTETSGRSGEVESEARYLVTRLPLVSDKSEFVLSLGFVQTTLEGGELARKQSLGSVLTARMGENFGSLVAYEMPEELSVLTPVAMNTQAQNKITDQNIATLVTGESQTLYWSDFTLLPLLNDSGEGTLVGIQPLYKTTSSIPIVTRVFVITGRGEVYHGGTLQEALDDLYRGDPGNVVISPTVDEAPLDGEVSTCEQYRLDAIAALEAQQPEKAARLTVEYWACSQ